MTLEVSETLEGARDDLSQIAGELSYFTDYVIGLMETHPDVGWMGLVSGLIQATSDCSQARQNVIQEIQADIPEPETESAYYITPEHRDAVLTEAAQRVRERLGNSVNQVEISVS